MPISTTCPHCRALFRLDEAMVGKKVRCQKCQTVFVVAASDPGVPPPSAEDLPPKASDAFDTPDAPPDAPPQSGADRIASGSPRPSKPSRAEDEREERDDPERRPRRRPQPAKSNTGMIILLVLLIGGGGFGCVICIGGAVGFWMMSAVEQQQVRRVQPPPPMVKMDKVGDAGGGVPRKDFIGFKNGQRVPVDLEFLLTDGSNIISREMLNPGGKGFQGLSVRGFAPGGLPVQFGADGRFRSDLVLTQANPRNHDNKLHQQYAVPCVAGKTYQFDMIANDFDAYLYLINDAGVTVAQNDDGGNSVNSRIRFAATRNATFYVQATSLVGFATGPYTFVAQERAK